MDISRLLDNGTALPDHIRGATPDSLDDWRDLIDDGDVTALRDAHIRSCAEGKHVPLQAMLQIALDGSDVETLQLLFDLGAKIEPSLDILAIKQERRPLQFFRILIKHGWPVGPRGMTNNLGHGREVVELLLASGRIVGVPCLLAAVRTGDAEVLAILLQNINPRAKVPLMADYEMAMNDPGYWASPRMFSEEPSLQRIIDEASLLQLAALYQEIDMVHHLLELKASVDLAPVAEQSPDGVNGCALHKAVSSAVVDRIPQPELVQMLLDANADPLLTDELGRTALDINEDWGHASTKDSIRCLLRSRMRSLDSAMFEAREARVTLKLIVAVTYC
ncbi:hypothetical protein CERZMDRAFT_106115 [Cercospora zeae-maydis SCOH1-5]|uniref:Uncharacterized protein n=1 Tax=Cercospora zeae-maydis SCOH1-5 TaxID=717836 RepID=A0A6A6FFR6_9PEZI|nr:hypothetical protein CERZMDRAFT_106115 [Cercospora zeae-maydis SCOH1-5]